MARGKQSLKWLCGARSLPQSSTRLVGKRVSALLVCALALLKNLTSPRGTNIILYAGSTGPFRNNDPALPCCLLPGVRVQAGERQLPPRLTCHCMHHNSVGYSSHLAVLQTDQEKLVKEQYVQKTKIAFASFNLFFLGALLANFTWNLTLLHRAKYVW